MRSSEGPESGNAPQPGPAIILSRARVRIPCVPTQRAATVELRSSLYADATAIVEREYAGELSLDDIARRVASSRRQLQRAYSEIGDTTFREHLTRVRMDRAAELLERGGMTVREVARRVGYRQPAQFAKAFRRHLGVAPSDFRAAGGGGRGVMGNGHRLAA
jgi:AraC family transcriptional regulator, regulatory protein of adaptative response / methylphosphotriester-DNA alkyltransferase methyltransferase